MGKLDQLPEPATVHTIEPDLQQFMAGVQHNDVSLQRHMAQLDPTDRAVVEQALAELRVSAQEGILRRGTNNLIDVQKQMVADLHSVITKGELAELAVA